MKLIFLDIDGVLITTESHRKGSQKEAEHFKEHGEGMSFLEEGKSKADPQCMEQLRRIVDETGARIVVSSAWRYGRSLEDLKSLITSMGGPSVVWGKTPDLSRRSRTIWISPSRGEEIHEFLTVEVGRRLESYVVLDDGKIRGHDGNYIQANWEGGLTPEVADQAIKILNGYVRGNDITDTAIDEIRHFPTDPPPSS